MEILVSSKKATLAKKMVKKSLNYFFLIEKEFYE